MIFAIERLRALRAGRPLPDGGTWESLPELGPVRLSERGFLVPGDLPADWRTDYEEDVAIRTIQYGQALERAEAEAWTATIRRMRDAGELPEGG